MGIGIVDGAGVTTDATTDVLPSRLRLDGTDGFTVDVVPDTVAGTAGTGAAHSGGGAVQLTCVVIVRGKVLTGDVEVTGTLTPGVIPGPKPGGAGIRPSADVTAVTSAGNGKPGNLIEGQDPATPGGKDP